MAQQPSKNATTLILVEMFRRLVQQYDRPLRKPSSGEVEPLRLAKRELVLPDPTVEPAGALKSDVEFDRCERSPQGLIRLESANRFARTVSSRTAASCRQSVVTARR